MRLLFSTLTLLAVTIAACGGETVDVGDKKNPSHDSDGRVGATAPTTGDAPSSTSAPSTASTDPTTPVDPNLATLDWTSASAPTCSINDVRGPFTDFSGGAPLIALGIMCPSTGVGCYKSGVQNYDLVVCRDAQGKVTCGSQTGSPAADNYGYDCCIFNSWNDPNPGYQCYWFVN